MFGFTSRFIENNTVFINDIFLSWNDPNRFRIQIILKRVRAGNHILVHNQVDIFFLFNFFNRYLQIGLIELGISMNIKKKEIGRQLIYSQLNNKL